MTEAEVQAGDLQNIPALFSHARAVYNQMLAEATLEIVEMAGDKELMVYTGQLTNLFKRLRLAVPYYTQIKNHLTGMGCIEQIRRGGGSAASKWVLWKEPELEAWKVHNPARPRRGNKTSQLEGMVKTLTERTEILEKRVGILVAAYNQLKAQVDAAEMRRAA